MAGPKAYDDDGLYKGVAGSGVLRSVSASETIRVDVSGPDTFGPDGASLFDVVQSIADNLDASPADPTALSNHLEALDAVMEKMKTAVAVVGSRAARVDRAEQMNFDRSLALQSQLAETENIDLPNTIMRLQMQQVGYQAALAATSKALQPTLLDYLR